MRDIEQEREEFEAWVYYWRETTADGRSMPIAWEAWQAAINSRPDKQEKNADDLLRCPFCGNEPEVFFKEERINIIHCIGRECRVRPTSGNHSTWESCIKAWNARPEQPINKDNEL